jgi:hypothetical protein
MPLDEVSKWQRKRQANLPNRNAGKSSTCQEHRHIDRCSLYDDSDCDQDTQDLHVSCSAEFVSEKHRGHGANSFASDVRGYNLRMLEL